jgi:hypothetical protein
MAIGTLCSLCKLLNYCYTEDTENTQSATEKNKAESFTFSTPRGEGLRKNCLNQFLYFECEEFYLFTFQISPLYF